MAICGGERPYLPQLTCIRSPFEALKDGAEMVTEIAYKWVIKNWKDIESSLTNTISRLQHF